MRHIEFYQGVRSCRKKILCEGELLYDRGDSSNGISDRLTES